MFSFFFCYNKKHVTEKHNESDVEFINDKALVKLVGLAKSGHQIYNLDTM